MYNFESVSSAQLLAFKNNAKKTDLVVKKQDILNSVSQFYNFTPTRVLCIGFNAFLFTAHEHPISVTGVDWEVQQYLTDQGVEFSYIPESELTKYNKQFQVVIAADEYLTYANTEQDQKSAVLKVCNLASEYVLTTLRDYKNQDYKDKEFSQPINNRTTDTSVIFLEWHDWSNQDRNSWVSTVYAIDQITAQMTRFGGFDRRTMYFKQLAKFSSDAGSTGFSVHKNLMYKGMIRRNYEHVITIKFDE